MQIYKYIIKARTGAVDMEMLDAVKGQLEQKLADDPNIVEHVDMNIESGSLDSISLSTYSKLQEGKENDLFDYVEANLKAIHEDQPSYPIIELPDYTGLDRVRFLGCEELKKNIDDDFDDAVKSISVNGELKL